VASKKTVSQSKKKAEVNKSPAPDEKKKGTSLRLRKDTLKALKIRAVEQDTSIQSLIEQLIEDYLNKSR